ncbi:MAG: hypothetical protein U1A27_14585 [Phycisphaerae bacterium]
MIFLARLCDRGGVTANYLRQLERLRNPPWRDPATAIRTALGGIQGAQSMLSTAQVLELTRMAFATAAPDLARLPTLRAAAAKDGLNGLARSCVALLAAAGAGDSSPAARYAALRAELDAPPQLVLARIYSHEWARSWDAPLEALGLRADFARHAGAVEYLTYQRNVDAAVAAVLPLVTARIAALADDLAAAGDATAAVECRSRLVYYLAGLFKYELRPAHRLLVADCLLALTGRVGPADAVAALQRFRDELRAAVDARCGAVVDLTDLPPSPSPAPVEYDRMFRPLAAAIATFLLAGGALLSLLLSALMRLARHQPAETPATGAPTDPAVPAAVPLALLREVLPPVTVAIVAVATIGWSATDQNLWGYRPLVCAVAIGLFGLAAPMVAGKAARSARLFGHALAIVVVLAVLLLPPTASVHVERAIRGSIAVALASGLFGAGLIGFALLRGWLAARRVPLDALQRWTRSAALAACLSAIGASILLAVHDGADRDYVTAVVAAANDPWPGIVGVERAASLPGEFDRLASPFVPPPVAASQPAPPPHDR